MSRRKKVLVLESEKLLGAAICSLLASQPEIDVTSVIFNGSISIDKVELAMPDVIIMDDNLVAENISKVMQLVNRHPKLRLIVVGLGDNQLHVFDKHIVQVNNVGDFFAQL